MTIPSKLVKISHNLPDTFAAGTEDALVLAAGDRRVRGRGLRRPRDLGQLPLARHVSRRGGGLGRVQERHPRAGRQSGSAEGNQDGVWYVDMSQESSLQNLPEINYRVTGDRVSWLG